MQPHFYHIHPALQHLVSSICIMEMDFGLHNINTQYHYPWSTQTRLCFYIHGDLLQTKKDDETTFTTCPEVFVVGPQMKGVMLNYGRSCTAVAICFHAGALHRLLNIPLAEISNQEIDATFLFGNEVKELNAKMQEAGSFKEIGDLLEGFLLRRLASAADLLPFDSAFNEVVRRNGNISVDNMASLSCLSTRQFERKCNEKLGMSPRLFAMLIRFSKAYAIKEKNPSLTWSDIAMNMGFYDQAHLVKSFKMFAGNNPSFVDQQIPSSLKVVSALEVHQ